MSDAMVGMNVERMAAPLNFTAFRWVVIVGPDVESISGGGSSGGGGGGGGPVKHYGHGMVHEIKLLDWGPDGMWVPLANSGSSAGISDQVINAVQAIQGVLVVGSVCFAACVYGTWVIMNGPAMTAMTGDLVSKNVTLDYDETGGLDKEGSYDEGVVADPIVLKNVIQPSPAEGLSRGRVALVYNAATRLVDIEADEV